MLEGVIYINGYYLPLTICINDETGAIVFETLNNNITFTGILALIQFINRSNYNGKNMAPSHIGEWYLPNVAIVTIMPDMNFTGLMIREFGYSVSKESRFTVELKLLSALWNWERPIPIFPQAT